MNRSSAPTCIVCLKRMSPRHHAALVSRAGSWLNPDQTTHSHALGGSYAVADSSVIPNLRDTTSGRREGCGRGARGALPRPLRSGAPRGARYRLAAVSAN